MQLLKYIPSPTIERFLACSNTFRCVVGAVGSGKTVGGVMDICYYIPHYMYETFNVTRTKWCLLRNTYAELEDTTLETVIEWFPWGKHQKQRGIYTITYPPPSNIEVRLLLRACDRPEQVKKFKSLEITGYLIDEANEVDESIKLMLKNRIGRFPRKSPAKFGIELTNPPTIEHAIFSNYDWQTPIPGYPDHKPTQPPLKNHIGFWQQERENEINLPKGYYDDLYESYANNKDWIDMYIKGMPGVITKGKTIYNNFKRDIHISPTTLKYHPSIPVLRGWDNSGNTPAVVIAQQPSPLSLNILSSQHHDKMGTIEFAKLIIAQCAIDYPDATFIDYADPAGENKFSKRAGGFTSNATLMRDLGINPIPSDQNFEARIASVDYFLSRIDGLIIDPSCHSLITGLSGAYIYQRGTHSPTDEAEKNRYSHEQDALQYITVKLFKNTRKKTPVKLKRSRAKARKQGWMGR